MNPEHAQGMPDIVLCAFGTQAMDSVLACSSVMEEEEESRILGVRAFDYNYSSGFPISVSSSFCPWFGRALQRMNSFANLFQSLLKIIMKA